MERITGITFKTDAGLANRARIGLIVLASDYTIESEWQTMVSGLSGVSLYHTRILNDDTITPETLKKMGPRLTDCAATLTPGSDVDVVAYGCTSASIVLGEETVFCAIHKSKPGCRVTTPITAALAAFNTLSLKRIAVLTPYREDVNTSVADYIQARGLQITSFGSFNEPRDSIVSRIDTASLTNAISMLVSQRKAEAVLVCCTSLRLIHECASLEKRFGMPIISSNTAMGWHALRLAGINDALPQFGLLYNYTLQR